MSLTTNSITDDKVVILTNSIPESSFPAAEGMEISLPEWNECIPANITQVIVVSSTVGSVEPFGEFVRTAYVMVEETELPLPESLQQEELWVPSVKTLRWII